MSRLAVRDQHRIILAKYIPSSFVDEVVELILKNPLEFKIVAPRNTKLGDFRYGPMLKRPQITVNRNLNPYSFLITTLHELAHYFAHLEYGARIKAHGKEWQSTYQKLIFPVVESGNLPQDIEDVLLKSLINVKASSCTDLNLMRVLRKYDLDKKDSVHLEELSENSVFQLNGKQFKKGKLRRTKFLCEELTTRKMYLVSPLAEIKINDNER